MKLYLVILLALAPITKANSFYIYNNTSSLTLTFYIGNADDCMGSGASTIGPITLGPGEDYYYPSPLSVNGVNIVGYGTFYDTCMGCGTFPPGSFPFTRFWDGADCSFRRFVILD